MADGKRTFVVRPNSGPKIEVTGDALNFSSKGRLIYIKNNKAIKAVFPAEQTQSIVEKED